MIKEKLTELRDYILQMNPYFDIGYDDVYQDGINGIINNGKIVFPSDSKGNFFYLRLPKDISFEYNNQHLISDCQPGLASVTPVVLIANIKNGDANKVLDNLIATVNQYGQGYIKFTKAIFIPENVILQELALTDEKIQIAALQRFDKKNVCLVSLTFTYTNTLLIKKPSCITNPCKSC